MDVGVMVIEEERASQKMIDYYFSRKMTCILTHNVNHFALLCAQIIGKNEEISSSIRKKVKRGAS